MDQNEENTFFNSFLTGRKYIGHKSCFSACLILVFLFQIVSRTYKNTDITRYCQFLSDKRDKSANRFYPGSFTSFHTESRVCVWVFRARSAPVRLSGANSWSGAHGEETGLVILAKTRLLDPEHQHTHIAPPSSPTPSGVATQ